MNIYLYSFVRKTLLSQEHYSQKNYIHLQYCGGMNIIRLIRVILFDVILHLCDTATDILQIYFLFLGKLISSYLNRWWTAILNFLSYKFRNNIIFTVDNFQMIQQEIGDIVCFLCGCFGFQLLLPNYIISQPVLGTEKIFFRYFSVL